MSFLFYCKCKWWILKKIKNVHFWGFEENNLKKFSVYI